VYSLASHSCLPFWSSLVAPHIILVNEFFYDNATHKLSLIFNGTGKPPSSIAVPSLAVMLEAKGTQEFPVRNVTLKGITFTQNRPTYLDPRGNPSGVFPPHFPSSSFFPPSCSPLSLGRTLYSLLPSLRRRGLGAGAGRCGAAGGNGGLSSVGMRVFQAGLQWYCPPPLFITRLATARYLHNPFLKPFRFSFQKESCCRGTTAVLPSPNAPFPAWANPPSPPGAAQTTMTALRAISREKR